MNTTKIFITAVIIAVISACDQGTDTSSFGSAGTDDSLDSSTTEDFESSTTEEIRVDVGSSNECPSWSTYREDDECNFISNETFICCFDDDKAWSCVDGLITQTTTREC